MAADRQAERADLEARLEAFEQARAASPDADLADFLLPDGHPCADEALLELVRLDLELGWARGAPRPLEDYRRRFPRLFQDADLVREVVFEECRLRVQAGHAPSVEEYRRAYGADVTDRLAPLGLPALGRPVPSRDSSHDAMKSAARGCHHFRLNPAGSGDAFDSVGGGSPGELAAADLFRDVHRSGPGAVRLPDGTIALPEAGSDFLHFRLIVELGRGTFGRVFLARQADLADRLVALKVAADLFAESHALAQLHHPGIVPVYSIHHVGVLQAVCMPWLGSVTLAMVCQGLRGAPLPSSGRHLVRALLERRSAFSTAAATDGEPPPAPSATDGPPSTVSLAAPKPPLETLARLSWVQAVVWVGSRVAEGLAHAHEHGIVHRDLKPANVLLTDDGQPVILDFNLCQDTKLRSSPAAARVGGTLAYMAPEQLEAFQAGWPAAWIQPAPGARLTPSPSSDLYSLGTVLFELLTGRPPQEVNGGPIQLVLPRLLEQRRAAPPRLRKWSPAVPGAVEAIVRRCLDPDPERRYPSARALAEDLRRQLADLPLLHVSEPRKERAGKWLRRHPRLSSTAVGAIAIVLILCLAGALANLRHLQQLAAAQAALRQLDEERLAADFLLDVGPLAPASVAGHLDRGVLLARLGRRDEAHREARAALARDARPPTLYRAARIYALTSRQHPEDCQEAFGLLNRALAGGFGLDVVEADPAMEPVRDHEAFRRMVKAAREMRAGQ
jgi:serine/threonine protein kinase